MESTIHTTKEISEGNLKTLLIIPMTIPQLRFQREGFKKYVEFSALGGLGVKIIIQLFNFTSNSYVITRLQGL